MTTVSAALNCDVAYDYHSDDFRGVIYDHDDFMIQAQGAPTLILTTFSLTTISLTIKDASFSINNQHLLFLCRVWYKLTHLLTGNGVGS